MNVKRAGRDWWIVVAIVASLTLFMAGCGGSSTSGGGSSKSAVTPKNMHIAFFTDGLNNAYLQAGVTAAKQVAQRTGVHMDILSGNFDINTQLSQVMSAISSNKYNAFVVEAIDGEVLCKPLTNAIKQGIVVSVYNTPLCGSPVGNANVTKLRTPGTVGFFGRYSYEVGRLYVQEIAKALGGKGKIAYVSGPVENSIVKEAEQGITDELKAYPNMHLVANVAGDWDPAKGLAATQGLLQAHRDLNGIIYDVDQMAVPSIKWMVENGKLGNIKTVSQGGTTQAFALIKQSRLYADVANLPREEAGYALQAAIDTLAHKPISSPGWNATSKIYNTLQDPQFKGAPGVIDKSNVAKLTPEWGV